MSWILFYDRTKALCDTTFTLTFSSFKVTIEMNLLVIKDTRGSLFCTCVHTAELVRNE